ncbi:MAG TPA: DUF58 domain-containing protein [Vicinamibacterales bacterium]|jgi:uncharacterized protein (DUF58 family)|nr:DUF58 domain-containing protein [Vicinamibacterales bacterium]
MRTREQEVEPLINLSEITEVELLILKRMREFTPGEHSSLFHGAGFNFVGLRDWQAGDRFEMIDWPQSSLTNFSPMIVREFEQPTTSGVIIVADRSASTRCGMDGVPIAITVARAIATIGMSAVFFQDSIGLITFDARSNQLGGVRPRIGKGQVIHCLEAYDEGRGLQDLKVAGSLNATLIGFSRKTSLVPVVSDFLFEDPEAVIRELSLANNVHDVFVVLVDAAYAFELPAVSAGWVEAFDVESGTTRMLSRREARTLQARVQAWQDDVAAMARKQDLDVLRLGRDQTKFDIALLEWVHERRLRRK